jgi:CheY-like chemotaxis protein
MIMHLLTNARNELKGQGEIKIDLKLIRLSEIECLTCHNKINTEYVALNFYFSGPSIDSTYTPELTEHSHTPASGLSLVSNLLHENNGHILISRIHSDNSLAKWGYHIQLLFKIATDTQKKQKPVAQNSAHDTIKNKSLMIIDNENSIATYMGELLRGAGFKTSVFCDSVEALNTFTDKPDSYDLIICSHYMPVLSGGLLVDKIMKLKPDTPAIICLDKTPLNEASSRNTDSKHFLSKPVDSAELLNSVMTLLLKR